MSRITMARMMVLKWDVDLLLGVGITFAAVRYIHVDVGMLSPDLHGCKKRAVCR